MLMNALLMWTTVHTIVTITMGPIHVHADKVLGFTVMDSDAMVSFTLHGCISLHATYHYQISMSVLLELTIVVTFALTLLAATPVAVQLVIDYKVMESPVKVRNNK